MIILHHLKIGRSLFTVWLLEELGVDYEVKIYSRNPETFRAQDDLRKVHPLGKSPVLEDGDLILTESGAITAYLIEKYDTEHKFAPGRDNLAEWARHTQWLHYPEGSVMFGLLVKLVLARGKQENEFLDRYSQAEIDLHLNYIADQLGDKPYLLGDELMGADICIGCAIGLAQKFGQLENHSNLQAYLSRLMERPAYQRAVEKVGE